MGDNQIVISIIDNYTLLENNINNAQLGDRHIVKKDDQYFIVEYDGKSWNYLKTDAIPKYIFVSDRLTAILFYHNKLWNLKKWFICSECKQLTLYRMKRMKGTDEICSHCFFKINYDNPNKHEYDCEPMTVGKYIKQFASNHNIEKCTNHNKCFLCDYIKGKLISGICGKELIYDKNLMDVLKSTYFDVII